MEEIPSFKGFSSLLRITVYELFSPLSDLSLNCLMKVLLHSAVFVDNDTSAVAEEKANMDYSHSWNKIKKRGTSASILIQNEVRNLYFL